MGCLVFVGVQVASAAAAVVVLSSSLKVLSSSVSLRGASSESSSSDSELRVETVSEQTEITREALIWSCSWSLLRMLCCFLLLLLLVVVVVVVVVVVLLSLLLFSCLFSPLWNDYNDDSDKQINGLKEKTMITAHFLFPYFFLFSSADE